MVDQKNLRLFWDNLENLHGDKTALIFEDIEGNTCEYSYTKMNENINKAANLFLSLGVEKGDRVALQMHNSPEFIISWFGLAKIGAVMVPINAYYLLDECAYVVLMCKPKVVIIEEKFSHIYEKLQKNERVSIEHILIVRLDTSVYSKYVNFNDALEQESSTLKRKVEIDSADTVEILFTSGTTSSPKGVEITHHNMLFAGPYTAWQGSIRSDDIYLTVMPAWHIDFQCTAALPTFASGATLVMIEKYSARKFWNQICCYRATITEFIPKIICTLMMQPKKVWEKNHCLRESFYYLTMAEKEKDAFIERFDVQLLTSYGMTETVVGLIGDRPNDERRWPSIGRLGFGYEGKIIDLEGNEVAPYTYGEIYVKGEPGKTIFKGYYNDEEATKKVLNKDGWLHTGDIGYQDADGYFYFSDRRSNLIKCAGENVSSEEIENYLSSHPKIFEAAVIGVEDMVCCELIKAFVVVNEGENLSEEEIIEYCANGLARFKVPSIVEKCTSLKHTSTGKIRKNILKNSEKTKLKGIENGY